MVNAMILEMLLSGSALIVMILLVRGIFGGRMGAKLRYGLWLTVLLRLLVPVSFGQLAVSPANFARTVREPDGLAVYTGPVYIGDPSGAGVTVSPDGRVGDPNSFGFARANQDGTVTRYASRHTIPNAPTAIWITGIAVLAVWFTICSALFYRHLRKTRTLLRQMGAVPVYVAETPSPCLFGLFRPAVYVNPDTAADETALAHALTHEETHLRHGDHIWAFLRTLCLTVWWFNPLVWLAAELSRRDCELCCDDSVIGVLGEDRRTEYGETLLSLSGGRRRAGASLCSTLSGGGRLLRRRIRAIASRKPPRLWAVAAAIVLAALAVFCAFSGAKQPWTALDGARHLF